MNPATDQVPPEFKANSKVQPKVISLPFSCFSPQWKVSSCSFTVTLLSPPAVVLSSTPNFTKHSNFKNHTSPLHNAFRVQGVYLILLPPNKLWPSFSSKDITH